MIELPSHPFDRGGLAALSDLRTSEWQELFGFLEQEQAAFLEQEAKFRSPEYKWPRDPLHTWSRVWEYPYVYYHLRKWKKGLPRSNQPRVVDLGSGVTFFPFSVARLGFHVICTDVDPICKKDLAHAAQCVNHDPGQVDFRLTDGLTLPFGDGEADALYCVSVLEHIPHFETMIQEIARILKPGGLVVVTVDLDLRGDAEFGVESHKILAAALRRHFAHLYPEVTIHPADLLHSSSAPYGYKPLRGLDWAWFMLKQYILKPMLGRKPTRMTPYHLAVQGFALVRPLEDE